MSRRGQLTAPTTVSWWIAVIAAGLGILIQLGVLKVRLGFDHFWLVAGAFLLLMMATLFKRL
jgi:hypothetical protein